MRVPPGLMPMRRTHSGTVAPCKFGLPESRKGTVHSTAQVYASHALPSPNRSLTPKTHDARGYDYLRTQGCKVL